MNKYQKAIEEIKKIVAFAEARNPKGNYPFSEEEEIFKKIYEITNGDFSEKILNPDFCDRICDDCGDYCSEDDICRDKYLTKPKTDWLPIKELTEKMELHWLADKDNNTAEGYLTERDTISIIKSENENFGIAVIFAKIKPPVLP